MKIQNKEKITVLFAGDSGDGIQFIGNQFSNIQAEFGNKINVYPNFPAEIRAPKGSLFGISGFQIQFGDKSVKTYGDEVDVLVVMNASAWVKNHNNLKQGGILITNKSGFNSKYLKFANLSENPLDTVGSKYQLINLDIDSIIKEIGNEFQELELLKLLKLLKFRNMFVLGLLCWIFERNINLTIKHIEKFFNKDNLIKRVNIKILKSGFYFGETSELINTKIKVNKSVLPKGIYTNIMGNKAISIGLIAASIKSKNDLFFSSYPITPASDILHELSKHKNYNVKVFQAEDEIAAIGAAIGASFAGNLAVTASSGPGISLKNESIGLAVILELPLIVINVQRGGPSTGLPTKTEQADLLQAMYGRNGEAELPIIVAKSPAYCFEASFLAAKIALKYMTPVILLSDAYISNSSEVYKIPDLEDLEDLKCNKIDAKNKLLDTFLPYIRNHDLARSWAIPGTEGLEHRIGSLEKEDKTGNISYEPENHQKMVKIRSKKIKLIENIIPEQQFELGDENDEILIVGWGSTFGAITSAVINLRKQNISIAYIHLTMIHPFPKNMDTILNKFDKIIVPELNNGQLIKIIQLKVNSRCVEGINKIKGVPFFEKELEFEILNLINKKK